MIDTIENVKKKITESYSKEILPIFLDTETIGLYGNIRLIQLYITGWQEVSIIDSFNEDLDELVDFLQDKWVVCHNATYDLTCLNRQFNFNPKTLRIIDDTLYLARHKFLKLENYSLDRVALACGFTGYEGIDKKAMQKSDFNGILLEEQYKYAELDVLALAHIWQTLKDYTSIPAYKIDIKSMMYAILYQRNGISVDTYLVAEELEVTKEAIEKNEQLLSGLNVNSPKQCCEALGLASTDASSLKKAMVTNELAKLVFDQRRLLKKQVLLKSYMKPKVYTIFNVAGAVSGRFTAKGKEITNGINSQQIPRYAKQYFYNTDPDMVTIEADYSTLELRLAATIFGCNRMRQQLIDGLDLHTEVAKALLGKDDIQKEDRTKAKAVNFGFVYGMSAVKFKDYAFDNYGLELSDSEASLWRAKYFAMYPEINAWHKNIWQHYKDDGFYVETAMQRKVSPKLGTDAINIPVQGSGAECTKLAIIELLTNNPEYITYIVNVVHDSIKLEVPRSIADEAQDLLRDSMLEAWNQILTSKLCKFKDIPMLVDIEVKSGFVCRQIP